MEKITISGLKIAAHHGVLPQERKVGNEFTVDVTLIVDAYKAMVSDEITDTVNYAEVADIVKQQMAVPSKLLEHVAWRIREAITSKFGSIISGGIVKISKLAPPIAAQLESVSFTTQW